MTELENRLSELTFKDEDGNNIPMDFLEDMLEIAIDEIDFVNKVTYGCTNENSRLDIHTDHNLHIYYRLVTDKQLESDKRDIDSLTHYMMGVYLIHGGGNQRWFTLGDPLSEYFNNRFYNHFGGWTDELSQQLGL